jgi:tetratricopeptide (TPR) repeat protein
LLDPDMLPPIQRQKFVAVAAVVLLTAVAFLPSLRNRAVSDDFALIVRRDAILKTPQGLWQLVTNPYWWGTADVEARHDLYRPFASATFWLDYQIGGLSPWAYHLSNLLVHCGVTLLTYAVLSPLSGQGLALAVAALTGVGPVAVTSVGWSSGRTDLWATLFALLFLFFFERARRGLSRWNLAGAMTAFFFALASKETAAIAPLVAWVLQHCRRSFAGHKAQAASAIRDYAVLLIPLAAYLTLRWAVLGTLGPREGGAAHLGVLTFVPRLPEQILRSVFHAVVPLHYRYFSELVWSEPGQRNLVFILGWIVFLALAVLIVRGLARRRLWAAGGTWFALVLVPVYALGQTWAPISDFYMYAGLPGLWLLVLDGGRELARKLKLTRFVEGGPAAIFIAAVAVVFAALTWSQLPILHSSMSLAQNSVRREPHSAKAMMSLAEEYFYQGQDSVADEWMRKAAITRPSDLRPWTISARHYLEAGNAGKAARFVDTLAVRGKYSAEAQALIARYYYEMGRCDLAVETFRHSLRLDYPSVGTLFDYGMALICAGDNRAAVEAYRAVIALAPSWPQAYANLGLALENTGRLSEAVAAYETAVRQAPDFAQAWESLAKVRLKVGDRSQAQQAADAYFRLDPPPDRAQRLREMLSQP